MPFQTPNKNVELRCCLYLVLSIKRVSSSHFPSITSYPSIPHRRSATEATCTAWDNPNILAVGGACGTTNSRQTWNLTDAFACKGWDVERTSAREKQIQLLKSGSKGALQSNVVEGEHFVTQNVPRWMMVFGCGRVIPSSIFSFPCGLTKS